LLTAVLLAPGVTGAEISSINQLVFAASSSGGTTTTTGTSSGTTTTTTTTTSGGTTTGSSTLPGVVTLSWTAPSTRSDGSPLSLSDIGGYRIYYGTTHASYNSKLDVANGTAQSATLSNLVAGTSYYLVMTTYDTGGAESGYSAEISKRAQ
jgi:hypothetical protein